MVIAADLLSRRTLDYDIRMDVLVAIKRLIVARRVEFTLKAEEERLSDGLSIEEIFESIVNANGLKKVLRSRSLARTRADEKLYIIESPSYSGVWIYTKGTIRRKDGQEVFYVLVSAKIAE